MRDELNVGKGSHRKSVVILIAQPTSIQSVGSKPKKIEEFVSQESSDTSSVRIAYMQRPCGWVEPCQMLELDDCMVVLRGTLTVEIRG